MILSALNKLLQKILLCVLHVYINYFSYFLPRVCRFYPSCSHYTKDAIKKHGVMRGFYYSSARILRCHPWHEGGYDPVPEQKFTQSSTRHSGHDDL